MWPIVSTESVTQSVTESAMGQAHGRGEQAGTYENDLAGSVRVAQQQIDRPVESVA